MSHEVILSEIYEMRTEDYESIRHYFLRLRKKALDIKNANGDTALHIAASRCWSYMVQKLLKYGATVDILNARGETPLQVAFTHVIAGVETYLIETIKELEKKHANLYVKNEDGDTLLHVAAKSEFVDTAEFLSRKERMYKSVNTANKRGLTPLHYAVMNRSFDLINLFLERKALNQKDNEYAETPLHLAGKDGNLPVLNSLLEHERFSNVNAATKIGERALYFFLNRIPRYNLGYPPYVVYCHDHWMEIFRRVILDDDFNTLLLLWKFDQKLDAESKLLKTNDKVDFLFYACHNGRIDCIDAIIGVYGVDVNYQRESGDTPLCKALRMGHIDLGIRLIDKHEADINLAGESLETPLHYYMRYWQFVGTRQLLERGADVNAVNRHGKTALYYARSPKVIEALLEFGAPVSYTTITEFQAMKDDFLHKDKIVDILLRAIIRMKVINRYLTQPGDPKDTELPIDFQPEFVKEYDKLCETEWEAFSRITYKAFELVDLLENVVDEELHIYIEMYGLDKYIDPVKYPELSKLVKTGYWKMWRRLGKFEIHDHTKPKKKPRAETCVDGIVIESKYKKYLLY